MFLKTFQQHLNIGDRQVTVRIQNSWGLDKNSSSQYINFVNLPKGVGTAGGGAEGENNRMSFNVEGFAKDGGPPPSGKVKVEMSRSALPREYKLRAKTGAPPVIAKYIADFLSKVAREVPPHFTHTR